MASLNMECLYPDDDEDEDGEVRVISFILYLLVYIYFLASCRSSLSVLGNSHFFCLYTIMSHLQAKLLLVLSDMVQTRTGLHILVLQSGALNIHSRHHPSRHSPKTVRVLVFRHDVSNFCSQIRTTYLARHRDSDYLFSPAKAKAQVTDKEATHELHWQRAHSLPDNL